MLGVIKIKFLSNTYRHGVVMEQKENEYMNLLR